MAIGRSNPAKSAAPAVNPELEILGQIRDIMQIVREWVETQKDLITQVNMLEGKINTLIATTQQSTQQPPTKKQRKRKVPRRKVAKTSSYLEED